MVLFYGVGLVEICFGDVFVNYLCDEYVLSMKVGCVIFDEIEDVLVCDFGEKGGLFEYGWLNCIVNDYLVDVMLCLIEDSLKCLCIDCFDIVWVYDIV